MLTLILSSTESRSTPLFDSTIFELDKVVGEELVLSRDISKQFSTVDPGGLTHWKKNTRVLNMRPVATRDIDVHSDYLSHQSL